MPHPQGTALHAPRVNLQGQHLSVIADVAVTHGYLESFDLGDPETLRLIPQIIRDIIIGYGAVTSTDYFKILDKMAEMADNKGESNGS